MTSCEYFKCSKYADRGYCWYSGLDTATYCSVADITHAYCTTPSGSFVALAHTYYIQRCTYVHLDSIPILCIHLESVHLEDAVNYSMDRYCSASFLYTFRCITTWFLYDDRVTRSSMSCNILVHVSLCNNMVAVRCSHLKISSMSCKIHEYISFVQHGCCTVLVSQKKYSTPCKILVYNTFVQHGCRTYRHYCVLQVYSLRNGNMMQIMPYVVMHRKSAISVYEQ